MCSFIQSTETVSFEMNNKHLFQFSLFAFVRGNFLFVCLHFAFYLRGSHFTFFMLLFGSIVELLFIGFLYGLLLSVLGVYVWSSISFYARICIEVVCII